jgi:hypothetical protein
MNRTWRILSGCLALALAAYFVHFAAKSLDLDLLRQALSSPGVAFSVTSAALLYALIVPISAWAWKKLLAVQAENWSVAGLALILGFSQIAKYVPGNIAQHAARGAMSLRAGMSPGSFLVTVAQETVLAIVASLAVGMTAWIASGRGFSQLSPSISTGVAAIGLALLSLVMILASVRLDPDELRSRQGPAWRWLAKLGGLPGPAATLSAMLAYSLNYLLIGTGLWLVAQAMGVADALGFLVVTSAFSLSWLLGFLAPGAPAGLGAREGIMLILLHGAAGNEDLLLFVVLARLVTMLGDLICFLGATIGRALANRTGGSSG